MIGNKKHNTNTRCKVAWRSHRFTRMYANDANKNSGAGFTLIELIVAMAVFSTVVIVISSIFVSVTGSQRKNVNNQEVLDNARFVLESVGRSVRQGDIVTPSGDGLSSCATANPCLKISHPIKGDVNYGLSGGQILENGVALSSGNVFVDRLDFNVAGRLTDDQIQPRVIVSFSLRSRNQPAGGDNTINLQTTITPRNLQIQQ